jgi:hypothetical protein
MTDWAKAETNTHQDHVIAHVVGATVDGYFVWDETAYLLLDIGFIWNIYLDGEMGLVPQSVAIAELDASDEIRSELSEDIDLIARGKGDSLHRMKATMAGSPIEMVGFFVCDKLRRIQLTCEESELIVETSLETAEVNIYEQ